MLRNGSITIQSGRSRNFCGEKEPFALLLPGSYGEVRFHMNGRYSGLEATYFVMNNIGSDGMLTLKLMVEQREITGSLVFVAAIFAFIIQHCFVEYK